MVAMADTLLFLEDELPGARTWAERHRVPLVWIPNDLEVRATVTHPETKEPFYLRGRFDGYKELPPIWTFTDKEWAAPPTFALFPKVENSPFGATMFIAANGGPVICAPFNRLAYHAHGGPHSDWSLAGWLAAGQANQVKAYYLGDMLQIIYRDVMLSRGRMG